MCYDDENLLVFFDEFKNYTLLNLLFFFLVPKTGTGLSCTIFKIPVNFSLSFDMKPGTSNPNKRYREFRSFR